MPRHHPIRLPLSIIASRILSRRLFSERGDVAEKIVIVGVFVALALAVGLLITHAVTVDAGNISNQIIKAK